MRSAIHRVAADEPDARRSILASALVVMLLCTGVISQDSSSEYTFRSKTELVLVNVTVRDKNGNPVRDLKREDFTRSRRQQAAEGAFLRSGKYRRGALDRRNRSRVAPTRPSHRAARAHRHRSKPVP